MTRLLGRKADHYKEGSLYNTIIGFHLHPNEDVHKLWVKHIVV